MADGEAPTRKSDLKVRFLSAIVMVLIAGTALWLGGLVWELFVIAVSLGVLSEWWGLVRSFAASLAGRVIWMIGGIVYAGLAALMLIMMRAEGPVGWTLLIMTLLGVIGTDVGAYFAGRTFGGPKIAPSISPSKTWSGLVGGMIGAGTLILLALQFNRVLVNWFLATGPDSENGASVDLAIGNMAVPFLFGAALAVVAQAGDFFESWMKRRAGVKDSGRLIPGHGGLFDRVDGLLAVVFVLALLLIAMTLWTLGTGGELVSDQL